MTMEDSLSIFPMGPDSATIFKRASLLRTTILHHREIQNARFELWGIQEDVHPAPRYPALSGEP